jgi:hypothetical protein
VEKSCVSCEVRTGFYIPEDAIVQMRNLCGCVASEHIHQLAERQICANQVSESERSNNKSRMQYRAKRTFPRNTAVASSQEASFESLVCPYAHSSAVTTVCDVAGDFHFQNAPPEQSPSSKDRRVPFYTITLPSLSH